MRRLLSPSSSNTSVWIVDDLRLIEWREADLLPDSFYGVDAARAHDDGAVITRTLEQIGG